MWRWQSQMLLMGFAGVLGAGCGSIEVPTTCSPVGQRFICTCSDGAEGEQECTASGRITVCECGLPETDTTTADVTADLPPSDGGPTDGATDAAEPDSEVVADGQADAADSDTGVLDAKDGASDEVDAAPDAKLDTDVVVYQCGLPGTDCDDGDECTSGDVCSEDDLCVGAPVDCPVSTVCNPNNGVCEPEPECQVSSDCPQPLCGSATCTDELCVNVEEPNTVAVFDGGHCGQIQDVFPGASGEVAEATIELWLRIDEVNKPARIIDGSNGPGGFQMEWNPFTGLRFEGDGEHAVSVNGLQEGVWYHVAAVVDGEKTTLFIDGDVVDTNVKADFLEIAETYIGLGCIYSGVGPQGPDRFEGAMDDLRISTVVRYQGSFLSPEEPHVPDENTWVLVDFEGPSFQDASPNKFACTWDGLPEYSTQGPYCGSSP